jgi:hypothetical protein
LAAFQIKPGSAKQLTPLNFSEEPLPNREIALADPAIANMNAEWQFACDNTSGAYS